MTIGEERMTSWTGRVRLAGKTLSEILGSGRANVLDSHPAAWSSCLPRSQNRATIYLIGIGALRAPAGMLDSADRQSGKSGLRTLPFG